MLIKWRRSRTLMTEASHPDPAQVPSLQAAYVANDGLPTRQIMELARQLGLVDVPPMTPSPGSLASLLQQHGPLWFAGLHPSGHVVVITGISDQNVAINDTSPVAKGAQRVISFQRFGQILQPLIEGPDGIVDAILRVLGLSAGKLTVNLLHFPG